MRNFFWGWYLKCQSDTQTLAVIPAVHRAGGKRSCSIQIITDSGAWTAAFPFHAFGHVGKTIFIGENRFGKDGIRLRLRRPGLTLCGKLNFGPLTPLKYDIMGPFTLVPFMECRHSVMSMQHAVQGTLYLNGEKYVFQESYGYWEGDRGYSFPKSYLWTQTFFPGGSLMLSVADIPILGTHFTGIIGVILWQGREYRLATYLGARIIRGSHRNVRIIQGNLELEARLLEESGHPLKAPAMGDMVRTIHESASCRAFYRFRKDKKTLFAFETNRASFEWEYPSQNH